MWEWKIAHREGGVRNSYLVAGGALLGPAVLLADVGVLVDLEGAVFALVVVVGQEGERGRRRTRCRCGRGAGGGGG